MSLSEFRTSYPQYDDLSDEELAKGLHKTYYSDLDYYDFSQRLGFEPPETIYQATPPMSVTKPKGPDLGIDLAPADYPGIEFNEDDFQDWYAGQALKTGISPDPDDPRHKYDYRAAYEVGAEPDETGHWPSKFKAPDHPRRIIDGIDTATGEPTGTLDMPADLSSLTIDSPTGKALMKTAAGMLFGEGLPEGLGYLQKPLETALDHWSKYFMTPEDEQSMRGKHPNLMAARYAATSLLLPGVSEKLASPEEMEAFARKSPEEQRVEILGLAAGYAVFGATAAGAKALLAKAAERYPWLTKPIGKWIGESNWYRQLTNRERGLVVQSMDDAIRGMESAGMSEAQILREVRKRGGAEAAYQRFAREQKIRPEPAYKPPEEFAGPKFRPEPKPEPAALPKPAAKIPYEGEKPIVLTGKNPGRGVIIHKSTKYPGKYQMTHWDHKGFISDHAFKTRAEAVEEARIDFKFTRLNPEAFDKISKTRMFNKSPEALERFKTHVWGKGEPSGPVIEMGEGKVAVDPDAEIKAITSDVQLLKDEKEWRKAVGTKDSRVFVQVKDSDFPELKKGVFGKVVEPGDMSKASPGKVLVEHELEGNTVQRYYNSLKMSPAKPSEVIPPWPGEKPKVSPDEINARLQTRNALLKDIEKLPDPEARIKAVDKILTDYPEFKSAPLMKIPAQIKIKALDEIEALKVEPEPPTEATATYTFKAGTNFTDTKKMALATIDDAIKAAKKEADPQGFVRFEDPESGARFDVVNKPGTLLDFRKNYNARMTMTGMSGKPPTRKGASTRPGKPKESWDLKKMIDFKNGWISDGAIVIKSAMPKGKLEWEKNVRLTAFDTVEDIIKGELIPAEVRYYTTTDPDMGEAIGKVPIVKLGEAYSYVIIKAGKKRYPFDVEKFNIITNRYPDATLKLDPKSMMLVAQDKGKPVAILAPHLFEGQKDIPNIKWAAKKGFADTGGYAEISAMVEMPELIQLFTKVTKGEYPRIKKHLGGLRIGQFRPMSGEIELKADIFKDPGTALKVLAHEIGHWIDWLPDKDIKRGNILGRLQSVSKYLKHWMDDILGGPGRLTDVDKKRLKEEAKKLEAGEKWIDEEIKKLLPIKPQDILDIWNAMIDPSAMNPALYDYVQRLSTADKKSIVKEAMKGQVRKDLEQFAQIVKTKTGKKIQVKIKASDQEVLDRYKKLIEEEIARRNIYNRDEIMDELKKFTHLWKPFDVHTDPAFAKYRYSSVELYADAVSGIMVNPNLFRMVAPKFWDAWNTWLHRKPEVMTAYKDAQKLIKSGSVEVTKRRMDDIYDMFYRGDMARLEARREAEGRVVSAYDAVSTYLWDKNHSALKVIRRLEKDTGLMGDHAKNTRWMLEELNYLANDANIYLSDIYSNVLDPLTVDGFHPKELGLVLFQRRILGDRSEIGNPLGHSPQTVSVDMENIERHIWGPKKTKRIHHFADRLRALRENQLFPLLEESGLTTPEFMKVIADTQDYATFSNVEWFKTKYGKGPGAAFYKQIGTLGEIENPLVSVILKDVSLMRAAHINMTKRELLIDLAYAGALQPAKLRWSKDVGRKGGRVPVEPTDPKMSLFSVMVEGKADHYYISKKIADTFKFAPVEAQQLAIIWRYLSQPIREVLVSKNPIWMARNVIRDFRQTIKNIPEVKLRHVPRLSKFYAKAFRETYKDIFKGKRSDDIRQLLEIKGIPVNRIWTGKEETFDMEIDRMAEEFQLSAIADRQAPTVRKKLKKLWDGLDKVGRLSDIWGKVAGFKYLKAHSERPIRGIAHVTRSRIGTPDYRRIGSGQEATNNLFLFSNVGKEGIRAAIESFREDPGGYIWKTIATNMLPKFIIAVLGAGVPIYFLKRMSDANDEDKNVKRIKYLQRIIEGMSEYDKSHYTNIPLGLTTKGKSVYIRLPEDYEGQFFGALAHKLINLKITGQDGLLRLIAEQSPYHFHPIIAATSRLISYYLMGQNPVDPYRGQYVMPDVVYKAGGAEAHKAMAKDVWKELGGSLIYRPAWDGLELDRAEWEKRLQKFPLNIVGTFVKISDRGITEKLEARIQEIRQRKAKETLRTNRAFIRMVNGEELTPEDALLILGKKDSAKRKKLLSLIGKKYGGAYVRQLARPLSNEEKIAVVNIMLKDVPN